MHYRHSHVQSSATMCEKELVRVGYPKHSRKRKLESALWQAIEAQPTVLPGLMQSYVMFTLRTDWHDIILILPALPVLFSKYQSWGPVCGDRPESRFLVQRDTNPVSLATLAPGPNPEPIAWGAALQAPSPLFQASGAHTQFANYSEVSPLHSLNPWRSFSITTPILFGFFLIS
jgi:hypothetical protein